MHIREIKGNSFNRSMLKEAKSKQDAGKEGMFLLHNGVVRQTPRQRVRQGIDNGSRVIGMEFSSDAAKVEAAIAATKKMKGIFHVRVWLNEGLLKPGDDIMYVLVGGDIRPHVFAALEFLIGRIKNECVTEVEHLEF